MLAYTAVVMYDYLPDDRMSHSQSFTSDETGSRTAFLPSLHCDSIKFNSIDQTDESKSNTMCLTKSRHATGNSNSLPKNNSSQMRRRSSSLSSLQMQLLPTYSYHDGDGCSDTSSVCGHVTDNEGDCIGSACCIHQPDLASGSGMINDFAPPHYIQFKHDESPCMYRAEDLICGPSIGRGHFGEVFRVTERSTGKMMVLKKLVNMNCHENESRFIQEASIMREFDHPNVLKFMGYLYQDRRLHLLTEYVDGGSLADLISDRKQPFDLGHKLKIAKDIACGMRYLHSKSIIHRDLTVRNILLRRHHRDFANDHPGDFINGAAAVGGACCSSGDSVTIRGRPFTCPMVYEAVVADFGLGRKVKSSNGQSSKLRKQVGDCYTMAPEMIHEKPYDKTVDMFSFGVTLCEIIGRTTSDPDDLARTKDFGVDRSQFIGRFGSGNPQLFCDIAFLCTSVPPYKRPLFCVLHRWLHLLCEAYDRLKKCQFAAARASSLTRAPLPTAENGMKSFDLPADAAPIPTDKRPSVPVLLPTGSNGMRIDETLQYKAAKYEINAWNPVDPSRQHAISQKSLPNGLSSPSLAHRKMSSSASSAKSVSQTVPTSATVGKRKMSNGQLVCGDGSEDTAVVSSLDDDCCVPVPVLQAQSLTTRNSSVSSVMSLSSGLTNGFDMV